MSFLRMDRGIVRGKKFATRKKAGEYVYRSAFGGFVDGDRATDFDQRSVSQPTAHGPRHVEKRDSGVCRRVYPHKGMWRVTVEDIWQSDHVSMEDALAGVRAIGIEPGQVKAGVVVVLA